MKSCLRPAARTGHCRRRCVNALASSAAATSQAIPVIVNGAAGRMGRELIRAVSAARGLELVGAVDVRQVIYQHERTLLISNRKVGEDAGTVAGLLEPLELPILDDLLVVLASLSQARRTGVFIDFTTPEVVFENVKQAVAFGMKAVIGTGPLSPKQLSMLAELSDKATAGIVVAPSFCIATALLQQAAAAAAFHYNYVDIIESESDASVAAPSASARRTAELLADIGKSFNVESCAESGPAWGDMTADGVRLHSLRLPGVLTSQEIVFGGPGERFTVRAEAVTRQAVARGVILCVRKVANLKSFVYGMDKLL